MDTNRLVSLVTAVELGSLSEAARRLGARLSTTSRHVSELEAELGQTLVIRTGRGIRPTPEGERFVERARFVLRELDTAVAEARGRGSAAPKQLRVSVPIEVALSLLPACCAEFHEHYPDVWLDVHSDARRVSLLEEDFDAAIRLGQLASSELLARPLGSVDILVCAPSRLANRCSRPEDLQSLEFAGVAGTRDQLTATVHGVPFVLRPQVRVRVSTFTEAAELACRTPLAVVLPAYTARRFLAAGHLQQVASALKVPPVPLTMLIAKRHRSTEALKTLASLVSTELDALRVGLSTRRDLSTGEGS